MGDIRGETESDTVIERPHGGIRSQTVTVLVTGFAPFREGDRINPSSAIASLLPAYLSPSPASRSNIRIIHYPYPIRVSYEHVRYLVPRLFAEYEQKVDMVLHIGMAPSRAYYSIERQAHRDGYDEYKDVDGKTLDKYDGANHWADCPSILQTSLDFDDVLDRWRHRISTTPYASPDVNGVEVRPSEDAGSYMCDFIYYSMMAEYCRHRGELDDPVDDRPVIFLHVPGSTTANDIRTGKAVTTALIEALAESWLRKKTSHYT